MSEISIREFSFPEDYERALRLWTSSGPGVRLGPSDTADEIRKKLARDPDLFLVAESAGQLVGTVIGGFDGRRGTVYHLAVDPAFRRRGIGTLLMGELEGRLRSKGCIRAYLVVRPENDGAARYYSAIGWGPLDDVLYAKNLT